MDDETVMDRESNADVPVTYAELIRDSAFIGEYSMEAIKEGIQKQFEDYIDLTDSTNYVDQFYEQWAASYLRSQTDEDEYHPEELREVLENIRDEFLSFLCELFERRLALTFDDLDDSKVDYEVIEPVLRKSYAYFILGARNNFTSLITKIVTPKVQSIVEDDLYWTTLDAELREFSPLVKCVTPTDFLQLTDPDLAEMFEKGYISGNFLTKYSPKLYQKEEFKIEITNHVTATIAVKEEVSAMPLAKPSRVSTSTQIRNFYSDGLSYLNVKFFNTNLSFQFFPFLAKNANGRNDYDLKHGQQTTVNPEGAFALYQHAKQIINGQIIEGSVSLNCLAGAVLTLERKLNDEAKYETVFSITKNDVTIPFKFQTVEQTVKENGIPVTKQLEVGLGSFMMTIEGYLHGINADRHLDKLTEDYANQRNEFKNRPQQGFTNPATMPYPQGAVGQPFPGSTPWNTTPVSGYQLPV